MEYIGQNQSSMGMSGFSNDRFVSTEVSQAKLPPHSGQTTTGNPPGFSGGKPSTTMSSTQSAWSHERQRYLNHSLAHVHGASVHSESGGIGCRFIGHLHEKHVLPISEDTILGMGEVFKLHGRTAFGTEKWIFVEGFLKEFGEGLAWEDAESERIRRRIGRKNVGEFLSHFGVADVAVNSVVTDAMEAFW